MELVREKPKQLWFLVLLATVLLLVYPYIGVFASEMGGLISEKLIGRSGISNSSLLIDRSGVGDSSFDMGLGAIASTLPATNIATQTVELNGNLLDLNDFPSAVAYFEWGYDTGYVGTTSSVTLTTTGTFSILLTDDYDSSRIIYFRAVTKTDGILYGNAQSFEVGGFYRGRALLKAVIPYILSGAIVLFTLKRFGNLAEFISGIFIALLAYYIAQIMLNLPL